MKNFCKFFTSIFALLLIVIFHAGIAVSQQVNEEWVVRFNGLENDIDYANDLVVDGFGNVFVTGYSKGNKTDFDFTTIKYNALGIQQWKSIYNGPGNGDDRANAIAMDDKGNIYVTGRSMGIGSNYEFVTIKYNLNGVEEWIARYTSQGDNWDEANALSIDDNGNVYVTGGNYRLTTIKYNSLGIEQWVRSFGESSHTGYALTIDNSHNVYVTGWGYVGGINYYDYITIKYNSDGIEEWVSTYNGPGNDLEYSRAISVDNFGSVYITGESWGNGTYSDFATIKYNSSGVEQWVARYNSPENSFESAYDLIIDNIGNVYVTGDRFTTIKYDSNGIEQWVHTFGGSGDRAIAIDLDNLGNVYVAGQISNFNSFFDYATLKINSSGNLEWVISYNGTANNWDGVSAMSIDSNLNIYVTGYSKGIDSDFDYVTIKYSQTVGIYNITSQVPSSFSLNQNYPNPFNPTTKIRFEIKNTSNVILKVFNSIGQEVAILIDEQLQAGSYEFMFDGDGLSNGVYYYRMKAGDFVETKKFILLK